MAKHLEYALRLLDRNIVCLPLRQGFKHLDLAAMGYRPVHLDSRSKRLKELAFTATAFHLAQVPPSRNMLSDWFDGYGGNIGILTGYNNLLVLDFDDVRHFERWRRGREAFVRSTPVARSPAGFHVYFRSSVPIIASSLHFGFRRVGHAKGLGGYVVASPSVLEDGRTYGWLPGQSIFDVEPASVTNLEAVSLKAVSPFKHLYDRLLDRGSFADV